MNSRSKGKRGELEVVHILREDGHKDARRGQQYRGGADSPDIIGLPGIHGEVKRVERLNLTEAYAQAVLDAGEGEIPTVFHKRNRGEWMATLSLKDFLRLYDGGSHGIHHD